MGGVLSGWDFMSGVLSSGVLSGWGFVCLPSTMWVKISDKIALPFTVKKIETNMCCCMFGKIEKFKISTIVGKINFH